MNTLIPSILSIVLVSVALAKPPASLHPENKIPNVSEKNNLDLNQYKNVKLKEKDEVSQPSCTSAAGVQYKPGTLSYDSCMKETERYAPTGLEDKNKKK